MEICPLVWGYSNYQWYKDGVAYSTSSCIDITVAGSYTLAGTNGNGCWSSPSTAVVVTTGTASATPTITAIGSTTFCSGGSVILKSSSTSGNQWYKDSVAIGGATDSVYTATAGGVYTVSVTACGSSTSAGTTVTANAAPVVNPIYGGNSVCVGTTLTLSDTTLGGTWASSNTSIATVSGGVVTALAAGTDTITYTKSAAGCTTIVSQVITVATITTPTLDVRGSTVLCGNSVEVCPLVWGYSNYQWYKNGVAYSTSACITITTVGSYTLTGQNSSGCWSTPSTAVVVTTGTPQAIPTITAGGATTFCSGGSVILKSSSTSGNQWYKDSIAIGGVTDSVYKATASGVYMVKVTACGSTSSAGTTVTVNAAPVVAPITGSTNVCLGSTITLADATAGGTWASSNTAIATVSAGVVTPVAAGTDTITYTKTSGGCSTVASITINVAAAVATPTLDIRGSVNICGSNTLQICPLVWGYSNYQWYKDGVAYSTASCINVNTAGAYTLTGTNGSGCWSSPSTPANVTINALPTVAATTGAANVCIGSSTTLSNSSTIPSGGTGVWSTPTSGLVAVNANTGLVTALTGGASAPIYYTVTSAVGCISTAIYTINLKSLPSVPTIQYASGTPNPQTGPGGSFCANKTFTVVGNPTGGVWSKTGVISVTTPGGVVSTGSVAGTGSLIYTYTDANSCSNFRTIVSNVMVCASKGDNGINNAQWISNNQYKMYPNPAKSFVNILVDKVVAEGNIVITDLYGKQVKTQALSMGTNNISINKLAPGMYFVSVITTEGKTTKKLVVE